MYKIHEFNSYIYFKSKTKQYAQERGPDHEQRYYFIQL